MDLFLDLVSFGFCCCSDVELLFIIQATTSAHLHISAVNCNLGIDSHYVWEDNIMMYLQEVGFGSID